MKRKATKQLQIIYRHPDALEPDPRNSRKHPKSQIDQLRQSILNYGFTKPVLLKGDEKTIGAGHGAWEAAKEAGLDLIPTINITGLTDKQWRAYVIADNRIPLNAEWNMEVLLGELNALQGFGMDLQQMGFAPLELGGMGVSGFSLPERMARADEIPPPPAKPVVQLGEVWHLGPHRIICGSSTDKDTVERLIKSAGKSPILMATDPPYGVSYDPKWRDGVLDAFSRPRARGEVDNDDRADWTEAWELFPGNTIYAWCASMNNDIVIASLEKAGFMRRSHIIWAKPHFTIGRGDYHWQHEPCWYAVRKGKPGGWAGDRKQTTVWNIASLNPMGIDRTALAENDPSGHGTQKPVDCMRRPILNSSKVGDLVYDPFLGSGTTLIAAQMENRMCCGVEINPAYVEVIIERWEKYTGKTAVREGDGITLAALHKGPAKPKAKAKKK